jgi:hypothetical protein
MGLRDWSIATVNRCPSFTDAGVCPMGPQKAHPGGGIPTLRPCAVAAGDRGRVSCIS